MTVEHANWIEFFRDPYSESAKALCDYVPEIREAKKIYEKAIHDYSNDIACAKEEGREEGKAEGKAEGKKETALSMLSDGMPVTSVSKYTGLSVQEIESLRN